MSEAKLEPRMLQTGIPSECPTCATAGLKSAVKLYQVNLEEAAVFCENPSVNITFQKVYFIVPNWYFFVSVLFHCSLRNCAQLLFHTSLHP